MADTNLVGAAVFWLYIIAALTFTALSIGTIVDLSSPTHVHTRRGAKLFVILAIVSFATLSFNMLSVLIQSYGLWATRRSVPAPSSVAMLLCNVRDWSLTSALFLDFGEAIVSDEPRYLWTVSTLLATFSVCLFMASEGHRRGIPRLWTFFALSQILPISFAQNLFYLALLHSPNPSTTLVVFLRIPLFASLAAYAICLLVAPIASKNGYLIEVIIGARLMLLLPLLLPKQTLTAKSGGRTDRASARWVKPQTCHTINIMATLLFVARQSYLIAANGWSFFDALGAVRTHPAIQSLGVDLIISAASFVVWKNVHLDGENDGAMHVKTA